MSDVPSWILDDPARYPLMPPLRGWPRTRNPELLTAVVAQFQVETAERYRLRDVTGDGVSESWCNLFAADVCDALGAPIPHRMLANQLHDWLLGPDGDALGWKPCTLIAAQAFVSAGCPVLASWRNIDGRPGHIAVLVPSPKPGLHCAQAGRSNHSCRPLVWGFGKLPFKLFHHL